MAVEGSVPEIGAPNGADDAFDYISESHTLAESAIVLPAPTPGDVVRFTLDPDQAVRPEFDITAATVRYDGVAVRITLPDGGVVELLPSFPGAFEVAPPLLLQPDSVVRQAATDLGLSLDGDAAPELTSTQDGTALEIPKPLEGETDEYVIAPGQNVQLGFSLDDVEILQAEADIVLLFQDGAQVTLSTLVGIALGDNPPSFTEPQGSVISASELIDDAGDITSLADTLGNIETAAGGGDVAPVTNRGLGAEFGGDGFQSSGNQTSGTTPGGGGGGFGGTATGGGGTGPGGGGGPADPPPPAPPPPNSVPTFSIQPTSAGPFGKPVLEADLGTAADIVRGQPELDGVLISVDYGPDGPGPGAPETLTFSDFDVVLSGSPPAGLTSGGVPVTYGPFDADTDTLTASAGGTPIFDIRLASTGEYVFDLRGPLDQDPGSIDLEFLATLTPKAETLAVLVDGNGDPVDLTGVELTRDITISVVDDAPVFLPAIPDPAASAVLSDIPPITALPDASVVDALPPIPNVETQSFSVDFGGDGAAATGPVVFTQAAVDGLSALGLESGGDALTITLSADGTVITAVTATGGADVFTLSLQESGANYSYTFNLSAALDHPAGDGANTLTLPVSVQATDADGTTASASFSITVTDGMPAVVAFGPSLTVPSVTVDEDDLAGGSDQTGDTTVSGDLQLSGALVTLNYGADGPGAGAPSSLTLSDFDLTLAGTPPSGLTSSGVPVTYGAFDPATGTLTASAGATDVFTVTLNADGSYDFALLAPLDHTAGGGENSLDLGFTVTAVPDAAVAATVVDGDGDVADLSGVQITRDFTVSVTDDIPSAGTLTGQTVVEGGGDVLTGNVLTGAEVGADGAAGLTVTQFTYTDVDGFPQTATAGQTVATQYGSLSVATDGAWSYTATGAASNNDGPAGDGFTFIAVDGDGDATAGTQTIDVVDGVAPQITFGARELPLNFFEVDEDGLPEGSDGVNSATVGEVINVTAGPDGAASVTIDPATVVLLNQRALTTDGEAVTFTLSDDALTVTGKTAAGDPVMTIQVSGSPQDGFRYDVSLQASVDHNAGFGQNALPTLPIRFIATDTDGTTGAGIAFFTVRDDTPKLVNDTVVEVTESGGVAATGNLLASATIGADDGDALTVAAFSYTDDQGVTRTGTIGQPVETQLGTLTVNADGTWSYTATGSGDQSAGAVADNFTYSIVDGDGDTATAVQQIRLLDAAGPTLTADGPAGVFGGTVSEAELGNGPDVLVQQATVAFGGDGPAAVDPVTFAPDVIAGLEGRNLTSGGTPLSFVQSGQLITATAGAETVFTLELGVVSKADADGNATYDYTFTLVQPLDHDPAAGEGAVISDILFPLTVTDADGTETSATVTINVTDDAPAVVDGPSVTLQEGNYLADGTLFEGSALGADQGALVSFTYTPRDGGAPETAAAGQTVLTEFGTLTVDADGTWSFAADTDLIKDLNAPADSGFGFTVRDGDGDIATAEQPLTVQAPLDASAVVTVSAEGNEDARIPLTITAEPAVASAFLQLADVSISNIPADARLFDAAGSEIAVAGGSVTLLPAQLTGLSIQRGTDISDDILGLQVTARIENTALGTSADTQVEGRVIVHAVADGPDLQATATVTGVDPGTDDRIRGTRDEDTLSGGGGDDRITGNKADDVIYGDLFFGDVQVALDISASLIDTDGSEIVSATVSGLPIGSTLSNALGDTLTAPTGSLVLTAAQLPGLTLSLEESQQPFTLEVSALTRDTDPDTGSVVQSGLKTVSLPIDPTSQAEPGDDVISGGSGDDSLFGNAGDDLLRGGRGDDLLKGGRGDDSLLGNAGDDVLRGGRGDDQLKGGQGDDRLIGNAGDDVLRGGRGDDVLKGGRGDDRLLGDAGDDVLRGGRGDDDLRGGTGDDRLLGNAGDDALKGGRGDDVLKGGKDDDVLQGGKGSDTLSGDDGDDTLVGGKHSDWIAGGSDSGTVTETATLQVTFREEHAGFHNTVGYFVLGEDGTPETGKILWHNVDDVERGDVRTIVLDGFTADQVGFFLVPNGARHTDAIGDGDDVAFAQNHRGDWVVQHDGEALRGTGNPAYFSGPADLNPDGHDHAEITRNVNADDDDDDRNDNEDNDDRDGTNDTGQIGVDSVLVGIEDLPNLGDADFDDAIIQVDPGTTVSVEGGDDLWGGSKNGNGDGQKDVFFHAKGDGVDTIHDFEVGIDQLVISGFDSDEVSIFEDGGDTIIRLGADEAVKLIGVSADTFADGANQETRNADGDGNGSLSVDELVNLRDDLFEGDSDDGAPDGNDAAIVYIAPVEPGVIDDGGNQGETS